jgi:hypothetical protein
LKHNAKPPFDGGLAQSGNLHVLPPILNDRSIDV